MHAGLLVETAVEGGLRWGELTELRVRDLDFSTRILTVSRAVVEVTPKHHPQARRLLVKGYPKDKEYRRFKLIQKSITGESGVMDALDLIDTSRPAGPSGPAPARSSRRRVAGRRPGPWPAARRSGCASRQAAVAGVGIADATRPRAGTDFKIL